jgi:hypothetical protein
MTHSPLRAATALALLLAGLAGSASSAAASDLRGSLGSMKRQHGVAVEEGYTFLRTEKQLETLAEKGSLVQLDGNDDYVVHGQVTHPYARPEVKLLIERLSAQYHEATGERLVVTSLARPIAEQPSNAHRLSVHPAGMAVDLRVPARASSRQWLESALLGLENRGMLDVTREFRPPHYHVAVFGEAYLAYATERQAEEAEQAAKAAAAEAAAREVAARRAAAATVAVAAQATVATPLAAADTERGSDLGEAILLGLGMMGLVAVPIARRRQQPRA